MSANDKRRWTLGPVSWGWPDDVDETGTDERWGYRYVPVIQNRTDLGAYDVARIMVDEGDDEMEADARLIAAAPEMLDTLRFLLPLLRRTAETRPEWDCWGINLHLEAAEEVERAIEIATGAKEGAA